MPSVEVEIASYPIRGAFTIARGSRTEARTVVCTLREGDHVGRGESVPYARYGEDIDEVRALIEATSLGTDPTVARAELRAAMPAGAARNALDCALWDLEAKVTGRPAHMSVCTTPPRPVTTAYTLSLGAVDEMADAARAARGHRLLKVKLGGRDGHDGARIRAVSGAAIDCRLILDANEGWSADELPSLMREAARAGVALIEQPLPVDEDAVLADLPHPVPICADESAHVAADLAALRSRYDYVNIKLDKAGGLTEALAMRTEARRLGFGVMLGCMVASSLAMAPAVLLAQEADLVDLDGPLLLARDREPALHYSGSIVSPPDRALWG